MKISVPNLWDNDVVNVVASYASLREAITRTGAMSDAGLEVLAMRAMAAADKYPCPDNDSTSAQGTMNDLLMTFAYYCRAVITERGEAANAARA